MPDDFELDPEFERTLTRLGPLMLQQEQAEAEEPDPEFVASLRARLIGETDPAIHREPDVAPTSAAPISITRKRRSPVFLGGLLVAAIAAALIAIVVDSRRADSPGSQKTASVALPHPNRTELTRGFPLENGLGAGGSVPSPWATDVDLPGGGAYAGHLSLSTGTLPAGPPLVPAYRLAGPSFDAGRVRTMARVVGIHGPVRRSGQPDGTWVYAADTTGPPVNTIHSIAVNMRTGEMIYHDTRNQSGVTRQLPRNDPKNVRATRTWLSSLGWPATMMPVYPPASPLEASLSSFVALSFPIAKGVTTPEAVMFVKPGGRILEAHVWPPVDRMYQVPARGYADAWPEVRDGKAPVSVHGVFMQHPGGATGTVSQTDVVQVRVTEATGRSFLVPAYRFRGTATVKGSPGPHPWLALVPASKS